MPSSKKKVTLRMEEDFDVETLIWTIQRDMGNDGLKEVILQAFKCIDEEEFFEEMKDRVANLE